MIRNKPMDWYVGRLVRLNTDIRTVCGQLFREGTVLEITNHWRGRLCLQYPHRPSRHLKRWTRAVPFAWFELVADEEGADLLPLEGGAA